MTPSVSEPQQRPERPRDEAHERLCLVTGATSGMGAATAEALAGMGHTVILVGRDPERGAAALDRIRHRTGDTAAEFMLADLSSQAQVRRLAADVRARHGRLDVLVNNVGAWFVRRQMSADGIEMTFALNHLAPFLLTTLLLEPLRASGAARIVNVSSYGHRRGHMDFADLQFERRPYSGMAAYRQSKLANLLFTYELARRLAGTAVTVNAVNPGNVGTHFGLSNLTFLRGRALAAAQWLYALAVRQSAEQGAQTAIYLATSPEVEGVSGRYFERRMPTESSAESRDLAAASTLWEVSERMTALRKGAGAEPLRA